MQSGSQWNLQENCGNKQRASKWEQTGIFIQSKRASHHHLRLTKTQRQAREWKTLQCKKGSLQVCFDWRSVQAGGKGSWRWTNWKWDILCDWFREHIWLSLVGLELEAETKKKGKLALTDQDLTLLGWLLQKWWFDFPFWLPQRLWVRVILLCMVYPLPICIYSVSGKILCHVLIFFNEF